MIDGFGGLDVDEAILSYVDDAVGGALARLDVDDARTAVALARLRHDCVLAKENLSLDTETVVPVFLPGRHFEIRLNRTTFDQMLRSHVESTVDALSRAVRSAGLTAADVDAVLFIGGSSRIPLVMETVTREFGRPLLEGVHPVHAVALGAAALAAVRVPAVPSGWSVDPVGAPAAAVGVPWFGANGADHAEAAAPVVDAARPSGPSHDGPTQVVDLPRFGAEDSDTRTAPRAGDVADTRPGFSQPPFPSPGPPGPVLPRPVLPGPVPPGPRSPQPPFSQAPFPQPPGSEPAAPDAPQASAYGQPWPVPPPPPAPARRRLDGGIVLMIVGTVVALLVLVLGVRAGVAARGRRPDRARTAVSGRDVAVATAGGETIEPRSLALTPRRAGVPAVGRARRRSVCARRRAPRRTSLVVAVSAPGIPHRAQRPAASSMICSRWSVQPPSSSWVKGTLRSAWLMMCPSGRAGESPRRWM